MTLNPQPSTLNPNPFLSKGGGGGVDKAAAAAKVSFGGGQGVFSVEDYQLSLLKVGDSRL